ncbi:hypothetical protein [uncultured Ilyobacter sp.]|uniref:hypothetical protein n=1 Tax=uncultured Ilyobacter sp. TaxID=544433 RepID=UPI002AA7B7A7|nr:hypothetical protein [uncultured Ilyobacter sp.]
MIISILSYGETEGRYELRRSKELTMFFPKSDSEYIDYLSEKKDAAAYFELAVIYLKKGSKSKSEDYLNLYIKEENDPRKLLEYYNIDKNYKKIEENLDRIISVADKRESLEYKKKIYREIKNKKLPISKEKYKVDKIQEFLSYEGEEEKQRKFFNSNKWTKGDIRKILDELKKHEIKEKTPSKKLFDMFATKKDRLVNRYHKIKSIEDTKGYFDYFDFAKRENIAVELKTPSEKLLYLKYEKNIEAYKEAKEKFIKEYLEKKNNRALYTLWTVTKDNNIIQYLKTQGEEYHHLYLKELLKKNKTSLFYSEGEKFLYLYPESFYRDEILEKLFSLASEVQKSDLVKKYTGVVDSRIFDRERINSAEGLAKIELVEREISRGSGEYTEEFIEELESLYIEKEVAEKLESLENREPYAVYLIQNDLVVPVEYRGAAARHLYRVEELDALYPFRKYIGKTELKELSEDSPRYKEEYARRYPLEDENIDLSKESYIYFSENPDLKESRVKEIENKKIMEPHEMYYAALYYKQKKDYVKSYRLSDALNQRYSFSKKIVELHRDNIQKLKKMGSKN